jgi:3'-phosphoadenosine 5'-phosphosulfate sulfotransferase (PAPS reductase)/FAD synthetase
VSALDEAIGDRPVIVSVSGGKDSTAMALHLRELGIAYRAVFMDTGWEHEDTYRYLRETLEPLIGPITWICKKDKKTGEQVTMVDLIRRKAMFPSRLKRFCTQQLKVFPIQGLCVETFEKTGHRPVNAVGIRAAESAPRAKMSEWEEQDEATIWRPILTWTLQDVIDIHAHHGVVPNPLYLRGASRVGCWPCIYARKGEIKTLARVDPARIELIRDLETEITIAADARAAAKGIVNEHPRTFFSGRGPAALGGRAGVMPIDKVVDWATTGRGGRQYALLEAPEEEGCLRWGLCDQAQGNGG